VLVLCLVCAAALSAQSVTHDRAFWRAIANNKYAVPEHESADALAQELGGVLGSPDPELRDDLAYSILARWIYRPNVLSTTTLVSLTDQWRSNLKDGLGEQGTNSVLKRSFSALCLSSMAGRERREPFMGAERYHALVGEAIGYLKDERDLRGYDAQLHWIHATAHTADLLGALADGPLLTKDEAAGILSAIDTRLATAPEVYTYGEQDRLAAAVVSVFRRSDFDASAFGPWLARIEEEDRDVWIATTLPSLARYQNHNYFLQALVVHLSLEPDSERLYEFRRQVFLVLKNR
jgi:hypothetical protein